MQLVDSDAIDTGIAVGADVIVITDPRKVGLTFGGADAVLNGVTVQTGKLHLNAVDIFAVKSGIIGSALNPGKPPAADEVHTVADVSLADTGTKPVNGTVFQSGEDSLF